MKKKAPIAPIEEIIEEALHSIDGVQRASPMPFLLTRIHARLHNANENMWEKAGWFIGRPAFAIPGLVMLIVVNFMVVVLNRTDSLIATTEQSALSSAEEFTYTVATIYDIENSEP